MNKSWQNNSNNSASGFIYFNTSNSFQSQNSTDTSDFLSFGSDSSPGVSPQPKQFCPSNYSSPRQCNSKNSRNWSRTPYTKKKFWRRNGGLSTPTNPNSNGNTYKDNYINKNHKKQSQCQNHSRNCSVFYDHTCLIDPWLELEEKYEEEKKKNSSIAKQLIAQVSSSEESSSEEASEDGSEEN